MELGFVRVQQYKIIHVAKIIFAPQLLLYKVIQFIEVDVPGKLAGEISQGNAHSPAAFIHGAIKHIMEKPLSLPVPYLSVAIRRRVVEVQVEARAGIAAIVPVAATDGSPRAGPVRRYSMRPKILCLYALHPAANHTAYLIYLA